MIPKMAPLEGQDAGPGDYTIIFDAGSIKGVDVVFEDCLSEAEAINSFIAWLRNLNEDGSEPVGWDGWKREFYANIDGAGTRRVVFETRWTSSFQVVKGTRETYGHKYRG